jgi:hypothetical protein
MEEVLTRKQRDMREGAALNALKDLLGAPESKDLLERYVLARDNDGVALYLTTEGLAIDPYTAKVDLTIELVRKFRLSEKSLYDLLQKLRAP